MKKKYSVLLHPSVNIQLDNHVRFATNVSTKFAKSIRDEFYKILLSEFPNDPERYSLWLPDFELSKPYRKILIKKRYLVVFYIEGNNVILDYFLDCRMDSSNLF